MPTVHGLPADQAHVDWVPPFEALLAKHGIKVRFVQLNGTATASAGTHKHGAFDLVVVATGPRTMAAAYKLVVAIARQCGADATWERPYNWDGRGGMRHIHGILTGAPDLAWVASQQIVAVRNNKNGLANNGPDTGPRPLSGRTYKQGIVWAKAQVTPPTVIRAALFNLPDAEKLPNTPARIAAGVQLVQKNGAPTFIAWNELVGIKGANIASDHARAVDSELSTTWLLVKPTLPYNENYISYRRDLLEVVKQYDDKVLPSEHGGRHLTRVVFKYKPSGQVFAVGVTHLVHGADDARDVSRQKQAADAVRYMGNVSELHDDCPSILLGDMNMHHDLQAAIHIGMKRASRWADDDHGQEKAATYTNYSKTVPSVNPEWAIDQIWFSSHWYVDEWAVLRNLTTAGNYRTPRPSDHDPSVAEAHIK